MKKYTITNIKTQNQGDTYLAYGNDDMQVSDGYHTMDELYEHRITLFIALCKIYRDEYSGTDIHPVWKSKLHADGSAYDGWFIMGIGKEKGSQISYHLPMRAWDITWWAEELEKAPEFDGHKSEHVLHRLLQL